MGRPQKGHGQGQGLGVGPEGNRNPCGDLRRDMTSSAQCAGVTQVATGGHMGWVLQTGEGTRYAEAGKTESPSRDTRHIVAWNQLLSYGR